MNEMEINLNNIFLHNGRTIIICFTYMGPVFKHDFFLIKFKIPKRCLQNNNRNN